jgi:hypothetical protein
VVKGWRESINPEEIGGNVKRLSVHQLRTTGLVRSQR